jgi:hypothetical protein
MTAVIISETIHVDELPGIWQPVQWELAEEERLAELDQQATASLLWAVDTPEAILRLLLDETAIERAYEPPQGYDPEQQGEWDETLVTFAFKRRAKLETVEREGDSLVVIYNLEGAGYWELEITPERVVIQRI